LHRTSVPANVGLGLIRGEIGRTDARLGYPSRASPRMALDASDAVLEPVSPLEPPALSGGTREAIERGGPTIGRPSPSRRRLDLRRMSAALGRSAVHGHAARDTPRRPNPRPSTSAGWSEQREELAGVDIERDAVDRPDGAEPLLEVDEADLGRGLGGERHRSASLRSPFGTRRTSSRHPQRAPDGVFEVRWRASKG
jgi:hypothetical protein